MIFASQKLDTESHTPVTHFTRGLFFQLPVEMDLNIPPSPASIIATPGMTPTPVNARITPRANDAPDISSDHCLIVSHTPDSFVTSQLSFAAPLFTECCIMPMPAAIMAMPGRMPTPVNASRTPSANEPTAISSDHFVMPSHTLCSLLRSQLFSAAPLPIE